MGKMLGSHEGAPLDRPDLNKCPDCGCFFATDACPLCGKVCPEEFRAGNRKPPKPQKRKRSSERITFMAWYYSWWFILVMMIFAPVVGIILFASSPRKKWVKITVSLLIAAFYCLPYICFFVMYILSFMLR